LLIADHELGVGKNNDQHYLQRLTTPKLTFASIYRKIRPFITRLASPFAAEE
jgi:ABC-type transport system involved in Fe-S cluster assembly fused permease/ATPase subunit